MTNIVKLSSYEAQKIAAGEVVERPANIVKELIENSIDATANHITLTIEDGGRSSIRVVDNGNGMSHEDAYACIEHHATSKITTVSDLEQIATYGFRGEALSSIASVSELQLITKEKAADEGIQLEIKQGTITEQKPVCTPTGTDITIRNIFSTIPARKKFLKKRETEWRHIQRLFQSFCFAYPSIHFTLYSEGSVYANCPPVTNLSERVAQVWDHNCVPHMVSLQTYKTKGISVHGIISNHHYARYDRNSIIFFVNQRLVKNQNLSRALSKGYLNVLPPGRFPAACVAIEIDPETIDINIHPRKEEVQFLHPRIVENAIQKSVKQTIEKNLSQQLNRTVALETTHAPATEQTPNTTPYIDQHPFEPAPKSTPDTYIPTGSTATAQTPSPHTQQAPLSQQHTQATMPKTTSTTQSTKQDTYSDQCSTVTSNTNTDKKKSDYNLIGQLNKTYLLLEKYDGLYLIDQHAAHERILYELFSERFQDVTTITLMFPHIITLSTETVKLIQPHFDLFIQNGIQLEAFGEQNVRITATPVHLKNIDFQDLINTVIGWIHDFQHLDQDAFFKKLNEHMHAQMACKAAIKAGDTLDHEQMIQLIRDLEKTENSFACPHGRPTGWLLSTYEIEKRFKRKT